MKSILVEKVINPIHSSFTAKYYEHEYFEAPLHIHPEYELILIEKGKGHAFIGNKSYKLKVGDFILLGPNLPHLWLSSDEYYVKETQLRSASVYAQFGENIFPTTDMEIEEFTEISYLLADSRQGILFTGDSSDPIKDMFRKLPSYHGFNKLIALYEILQRLSSCPYTLLTDSSYNNQFDQKDMSSIIEQANLYMNQNYQENISLQQIATFVSMNASALCRYYKRHTGKTLFNYLAELRISYATKLLTNRSISISQVAYDCGYNNLSHFDRQFKSLTGKTPSEYYWELHKQE